MPINTDPPPPCKIGPCGYHCNCFNDIDWDFPGCQWCKLLDEEKKRDVKIVELVDEKDQILRAMSPVYSLLSLLRHRHMPRGLDSLERDVDKALAGAEAFLDVWWKKEMALQQKTQAPAHFGCIHCESGTPIPSPCPKCGR